MSSNFTRFLILSLFSFAAACSEQKVKEDVSTPPAYVTNAEYVLEALKSNKTSAVAFQVKPVRSTACEHMYIEFGQKNSEGQWEVTNAIFPGKDPRDDFGQDVLANQTHFAEVDEAGEYGVIALGCKPYGRDIKIYKGLFATFEVAHERLNYIGEIALIPAGSEFATVYVVNGTDFTREQIRAQLPELGPFLQENMMEKYIPKLTKEQQAYLDDLDAKRKAMQPVLDMRNQVAAEYNLTVKDWNNWLDKYGGINNENKTTEAERKSLIIFKRKEALEDRLELHDKFIDEGRSLKYVKRYIFLLNDYENKKVNDTMENRADAHDALLKFKRNNP